MREQLKEVVRIFILGVDSNFIRKEDEYGNIWQIGTGNKNLYLSTEFGQTLVNWALRNRVDESGELYRILERENSKDHLIVSGHLETATDEILEEVLKVSSEIDYRIINVQELRRILEGFIKYPLAVITERKLQLNPHFEVTVKNKVIKIRNSKWHHSNYDIGLSSNLGPDDIPQVVAVFSPINDSLGFSVALDKPVKESVQLLLSRILDFMK